MADRGFAVGTSQLAAFQAEGRASYVRSLARFLRDQVPGAEREEEEYLLDFARAMVERAEGYGLKTKRDAAVYVTSAYLLGRSFEENFQAAKRVLGSSLPGREKAKWLHDATISLIDCRGRTPQ